MLKVLIVDDDLMLADNLEEILLSGGYSVCGIACTVAEAISLGREQHPVPHRVSFSSIARILNQPDSRVGRGITPDRVSRSIARAVVHDKHFPIQEPLCFQIFEDAVERGRQSPFFVIGRNDDG